MNFRRSEPRSGPAAPTETGSDLDRRWPGGGSFIGFLMHNLIYPAPSQPAQNKFTLPTTPDSYIGVYEAGCRNHTRE